MSPTKLPQRKKPAFRMRRPLFRNALSAATAISFSLTFVVAGIALLLGIVPPRSITGAGEIDTAVVLLFVPLCALLLAILVEVVRSVLREGLQAPKPRNTSPLSAWKPGNGEG
jgi:hypothetical protein